MIFKIILLIIVFISASFYYLYDKKTNEEKQIEKFWSWFMMNEDILFRKDLNDPISDKKYIEGNNILMKIDRNINFEITGNRNDGKKYLILTANGVLESFPIIEILYEFKPDLKNWEVEKFRSPKDRFENITYEEIEYSIKDFYIELIKGYIKDEDKNIISLNVYYKDLDETNLPHIQAVSMTFIDHMLGEYFFTTKIRGPINFYKLPEKKASNIYPLEDIKKLALSINDFIKD